MKDTFFEPSFVFKPFVPVIPLAKTDADKFPAINQELSKYSGDFLLDFVRVLPASKNTFGIPIPKTVRILVKGRQVGATTMSPTSLMKTEYVYFDSEEEFWARWNRFKNMKAFL